MKVTSGIPGIHSVKYFHNPSKAIVYPVLCPLPAMVLLDIACPRYCESLTPRYVFPLLQPSRFPNAYTISLYPFQRSVPKYPRLHTTQYIHPLCTNRLSVPHPTMAQMLWFPLPNGPLYPGRATYSL